MTKILLLLPLLLLAAAALRLVRTPKPAPSRPDEPLRRAQLAPGENAAARAALLAMRGMLHERALVDRVRILPDPTLLTDREAAARLSAMAKPVRCASRISGDVLEIDCEESPPEGRGTLASRPADEPEEYLFAPEELEQMRSTGNERVLVVGRGESMVIERKDYVRLWSDYEFASAYMCAARPPEYFGDHSGAALTARRFSPHAPQATVRVREE